MGNHKSSSKAKLISIAVWVIVYLVAEIMMLSPLIRARTEASSLTQYGISTEAEVFDPLLDTEITYFITNLHRLSYRFSASDPESGQAMTVTGGQWVSGDTWLHLNAGDRITISYLPSDPRVSRLAGSDSDNTDLSDFLIYVAVLGPPIALVLWAGLRWLIKWIDSQNTMP